MILRCLLPGILFSRLPLAATSNFKDNGFENLGRSLGDGFDGSCGTGGGQGHHVQLGQLDLIERRQSILWRLDIRSHGAAAKEGDDQDWHDVFTTASFHVSSTPTASASQRRFYGDVPVLFGSKYELKTNYHQ
jgi:hypothetical protein